MDGIGSSQPNAGSGQAAVGAQGMASSTLINRNVMLGRKRTSVRLERAMWDALEEICRREQWSLSELCLRVNERRRESTLTAAIRVYTLCYFKIAATEDGHASAGHGSL
ncbi:MAG: ribbon-helix-helix domain-containing protein [Pseudomonadota bacterium]